MVPIGAASVRPARTAGGCRRLRVLGEETAEHSSTSPPPQAGREPLFAPLLPRHVLRRHRDRGVGARLPADPAEAGGAGVRLPGALPGCRSRDESGVGDRGRPVLPVPVGVLLEARELRELAVQQHAGLR